MHRVPIHLLCGNGLTVYAVAAGHCPHVTVHTPTYMSQAKLQSQTALPGQ